MAVVNKVVEVVARAVDLQARQAESTATSLASTVLTSIASMSLPTATLPSPTVIVPETVTPTVIASQSPTNGGGGSNPGGSTSSPLLFFVALGFGVVFTNLWIIVGVKYCFRYNSRNRQLRLTEDGEPIGMENMHPRPRRRREKKLMTMDEVNEKFPMLKYKNWVASRVKEGLPARGGVSAPPSRANSVRSVEAIVPEIASKEREASEEPSTPKEKTDSKTLSKDASSNSPGTTSRTEGQASTAATPVAAVPPRASDEHTDDDEDDEHINAAIPPECMGTTGDTCAICIDTIEDDDDVRGLTCGHAFHAVCLDPWLTSRRACCPLCKADYYTPKPRPQPPEGGEAAANGAGYVTVAIAGDGRQRMNMPSRPQGTWISMRGTGRMFPVRFVIRGSDHVVDQPSNADAAAAAAARRRPGFFSRPRQRTDGAAAGSQAAEAPSAPRTNWLSNVRSGLPTLRNPLRRQEAQAQGQTDPPVASGANPAAPPVSPSQLEAGVRTEAR